jgi:hypothetical protein
LEKENVGSLSPDAVGEPPGPYDSLYASVCGAVRKGPPKESGREGPPCSIQRKNTRTKKAKNAIEGLIDGEDDGCSAIKLFF